LVNALGPREEGAAMRSRQRGQRLPRAGVTGVCLPWRGGSPATDRQRKQSSSHPAGADQDIARSLRGVVPFATSSCAVWPSG
jgi:hypothetical protein